LPVAGARPPEHRDGDVSPQRPLPDIPGGKLATL
jgi:hypothetical protein